MSSLQPSKAEGAGAIDSNLNHSFWNQMASFSAVKDLILLNQLEKFPFYLNSFVWKDF